MDAEFASWRETYFYQVEIRSITSKTIELRRSKFILTSSSTHAACIRTCTSLPSVVWSLKMNSRDHPRKCDLEFRQFFEPNFEGLFNIVLEYVLHPSPKNGPKYLRGFLQIFNPSSTEKWQSSPLRYNSNTVYHEFADFGWFHQYFFANSSNSYIIWVSLYLTFFLETSRLFSSTRVLFPPKSSKFLILQRAKYSFIETPFYSISADSFVVISSEETNVKERDRHVTGMKHT